MDSNINKLDNESFIDSNQINFEEILNSIKRRKKIIFLTFSIIFSFTILNLAYRRLTSPQYLGTFSMLIRDPIVNKSREASGSGFIEDLAINNTYSDIPTLIQYLRSERVIGSTAISNDISSIALKNRINIFVPKTDSNGFFPSILQIDVIGPDKVKLRKIVQELSNAYINIASETKKEKLTEGIKFLNKERPSLEKRAGKLQDDLEKFRLENKLINPISEAKSLTLRIEQTKNKILLLKSENIRLIFIKENLVNGILFTEGINDRSENSGLDITGAEQLLLQEILDVKSALAKARSTYTKTSSVVLNLQEKLNRLEPILLENQMSAVDAAIIVNKGKIKSSENELSELEKQFSNLPKLINNFSKIERDQKLIEQNLEYLLSAKEKLELELSQGTLPWKIISKPYIFSKPFKPEIKINLVYGLIISLSLALILALIIDKLDDVYHSPDEIEKDNNLAPLLGFIPFFKLSSNNTSTKEKQFLTLNSFKKMNEENKSFNFIFEETFRNLYTSIKYSTSDKEIKTIAITSTIPSEGKSLLSILLSLNVSEIGKRILIIDCDLRRPTLHKKLEVDNVFGLSNLLVDENYKWQDATNKIEGYSNFSFITGGKVPPNPIKLLDSQKMKNLVNEITKSKEYDLIIFDCPPILGLSDSLIISQYVDGAILTISLNKVKRELVKECAQKLNTGSTEVLGIIANNVKEDFREFNPRNKYYYQYKYGYQNKYLPLETGYAYSNIDSEVEEELKNEQESNLFIKSTNFLKDFKNKLISWINE